MFFKVGFKLGISSKFAYKMFRDNEFAKGCFVNMFSLGKAFV